MKCRSGCGACCTYISISSALPGMPNGKPAGVTCVNLDSKTYLCTIWGTPNYPSVCTEFTSTEEFCGTNREEAITRFRLLEEATRPEKSSPLKK